jgi:hypothetical protein
MTSEELIDEAYLSVEIEKIEKIVDKSKECFTGLRQEGEKLEKIYEGIKTEPKNGSEAQETVKKGMR